MSLAGVRVVLVATQHPGNIGAAARAMLTMGLDQLVLVAPERFPHPQARAQAAGALAVVESARVVATLEEAVADCGWVVATSARPRHLGDEPLTPWDLAREVAARAPHAAIALVFGAERIGLTNAQLDRCHRVAMIPANPDYSSLNLAQAVQVMCWELRKATLAEVPSVSPKAGLADYAPPAAAEMERFYEHLQRVLLATGFLDPANPRALMRRLRQFFNRAHPDRNELNILRGVFKSVEQPKRRRGPAAGAGEPAPERSPDES